MIEETQEEIDEQVHMNNRLKDAKYKVNRSVASGLLKDEIIEMLFAPPDVLELQYNKLIVTIKRFTIPIIPNRYFEIKPKLNNKYFLKKRKTI